MSFKDLGLLPELLKAIQEQEYSTPTPIQQQAIPLILEGKDLMASAQTGTGKTAGFTLPILQRLMKGHKNLKQRQPRALILAPTRELAAQLGESIRAYGKHLPLTSTVIFGGVKMYAQVKSLRQGVDIIIATPGRLLDHVQQRNVSLSQIELFVLDEADRMLDMGFIQDIRKILALLPKSRQSLLFSATFSDEVKGLASGFLNAPKTIETERVNTPADLVSQTIYPVDSGRKRDLLHFLISSENWKQVLVFTRTKHVANRLSEQLSKDGIPSAAIHGNKSQAARIKALSGFKRNSIRVLVATDIAARGLDIDQLPHVVNFELPLAAEDYVHRIGRTGRAGNTGEAISLVCVDEHRLLKGIEKLLKKTIPSKTIPGYEPNPTIKPKPIASGQNFQFRKAHQQGKKSSRNRRFSR